MLDGGRFFLNGKPFALIAEPSDTVHVKWERPHFLPVPDAALQRGRKEITVRTQPTLASISLEFPRIAIGPEVELLPYYGRRLFWVREIPQFTSVICVVVATFVLFIWTLDTALARTRPGSDSTASTRRRRNSGPSSTIRTLIF